eukprot:4903513-Pleurochrysis_carterae.AAC.1
MSVAYPEPQPRKKPEAVRALVFAGCETESLADGLAAGRKDTVKSVSGMLGSYWGRALKPSVVDLSEPCLILGYGDATGGGWGPDYTF